MRIGIIGTGWGVRAQVPGFRAAGLEVVALAGRDVAKTRSVAATLGLEAFDSWQELLRADVDLVSITPPPDLHHEMALAALASGKHVLCEKPTAMNSREAAAMFGAAQQHPDRLTLIDHELRFLPASLAAQAIVRRGDLGSLRYAICTVSGVHQSDPTRPWSWMSDLRQGGGLWGSMGSHQIDLLRFLWGEIEAVSLTVHTFVSTRPHAGGTKAVSADDFLLAQLRFAGGGFGSLTLSMVAAREEPSSLTIQGSCGALRLQGGRLVVTQGGEPWVDCTPADPVSIPANLPDSDFGRGTVYLGHALRAYDGGHREAVSPGSTFWDGLRNQQVLDAGRRSYANDSAWERVAE